MQKLKMLTISHQFSRIINYHIFSRWRQTFNFNVDINMRLIQYIEFLYSILPYGLVLFYLYTTVKKESIDQFTLNILFWLTMIDNDDKSK